MTQPGSAYSLDKREEKPETHTLTVLVDNEPGVLARVIGLFSGRGYNIESLTVSETEHEAHLSRITIVTSGPPMVIEQIQHQLERLIPVHSVTDLTVKGNPIERELAMVKVAGLGEKRVEAMRLADAFRASVIDASTEHFVFEITGKQSKIEQFIALMQPLGLVEVSRTAVRSTIPVPANTEPLVGGVLHLTDTPPGDYVLELIVVDRLDRKATRASQTIDFSVFR